MLKDASFINAFFANAILAGVWHIVTFLICVFVSPNFFDPEKRIYRPHKWEKGGRFYRDVLKINKWKDHVPRYTGKDGFSKDHIDDTSIEYIDRFILETCRGEWNHRVNCLLSLVMLLVNNITYGIIFSLCVLAGNLPFAVIQRYNRFRLQRLRDNLIRRKELQSNSQPA